MSIDQERRVDQVEGQSEVSQSSEKTEVTADVVKDHMDSDASKAIANITGVETKITSGLSTEAAMEVVHAAEGAKQEIQLAEREAMNQVALAQTLEKLGLDALPSTEKLNELYGYTPPTAEKKEKQELHIEWTTELQQKLLSEMLAGMSVYMDPDSTERWNKRKSSFAINENVNCAVEKYFDTEFGTVVEVKLETGGKTVADFRCGISAFDPVVKLHHRYVDDALRGQGVGSQLLESVEGLTSRMSKAFDEDFTLKIEARQLGMLGFAMKNGFAPKEGDVENLKQIYVGDPDLLVETSKGYPNEVDGGRRPGFMFSKKDVKKQMAMIQETEKDFSDVEVQKQIDRLGAHDQEGWGHTITFEKKFTPENAV